MPSALLPEAHTTSSASLYMARSTTRGTGEAPWIRRWRQSRGWRRLEIRCGPPAEVARGTGRTPSTPPALRHRTAASPGRVRRSCSNSRPAGRYPCSWAGRGGYLRRTPNVVAVARCRTSCAPPARWLAVGPGHHIERSATIGARVHRRPAWSRARCSARCGDLAAESITERSRLSNRDVEAALRSATL